MVGGRALPLSVVLLLALSGCIQTQQTGGGEKAKVLDEKPYAKRDVDAILSSTSYDDPKRFEKAKQLAALGPAAAPTLLRVLEGDDGSKSEAAAYALSRVVFDSDEKTRRAVGAGLKGHFDDENDFVRETSAGVSVALGDSSGIPVLIEYLRYEEMNPWTDPPEPYGAYAIAVLKAFTKEDFGYDPYAPSSENEGPIQKWGEWWGDNKDRLVWEPNNGEYGTYEVK